MAVNSKDQVCIVIDPYSSGRFLVEELKTRGEKVVAVRSNLDVMEGLIQHFQPDLYHGVYDVVPASTDCKIVAAEIEKSWGIPKAIFAGCEAGVILTEQLQNYWGHASNDSATGDVRRHKAKQQDCLREKGVRAIKQLFSASLEEILAYRKQHLEFPVVIKPPLSAGTDGVYFCNDDQQITDAYNKNIGTTDILGNKTEKVLLQEFLQGREYVVDCVSRAGEHILSGIWVYKKHADIASGTITYDQTEFLPSDGEVQDQLIEYIMGEGGVLDALGIKYGPSHSEVMMTPTGPCLVESGNRMHGCDGPKTIEHCTGVGLHHLTADIALGGDLFDKCKVRGRYPLIKKAVCLSLFNDSKCGILTRDVDCYELREACKRSVRDVSAQKKGDTLVPTRDLVTIPGDVLLIHEDEAVVWEDIAAIRKLEATGVLYNVEQDECRGMVIDNKSDVSTAVQSYSPSAKSSQPSN